MPTLKPTPTENCAGAGNGAAVMSNAAIIAGRVLKIRTFPP
jgi:hypothetical protein